MTLKKHLCGSLRLNLSYRKEYLTAEERKVLLDKILTRVFTNWLIANFEHLGNEDILVVKQTCNSFAI